MHAASGQVRRGPPSSYTSSLIASGLLTAVSGLAFLDVAEASHSWCQLKCPEKLGMFQDLLFCLLQLGLLLSRAFSQACCSDDPKLRHMLEC